MDKRFVRVLTLGLLPGFAILADAGLGATWHVDANAKGVGNSGICWDQALPSIQVAIEQAATGDEILVAPGDYEPIATSSSKKLAIRSTAGAATTSLNGEGIGRCAVLADEDGLASGDILLEGFTLRNGFDASFEGGGAVYGGQLLNCVLVDNAAIYGGAASCATLENCLLTDNEAAHDGGGAIASLLVNCTVANNTAGAAGGGTSDCDLYNSIVWTNDAPADPDVAGGTAAYTCTSAPPPGEGNLSADPAFLDPLAGDYRLADDSAVVDAGDASVAGDTPDLDGGSRLLGTSVDLGAYESSGSRARTCARATAPQNRTVTVTFNANGGKCALISQEYALNTLYSTLPKPTRAGNRFIGWYTAPRGGTRIVVDTPVSKTVTTLYAHWGRLMTVNFNANGGKCTLASKEYAMNYSYAKLPTPVRAGHRFLGWFTHPTEGTPIVATSKVSQAVTTLYAHWSRLVIVTFDANGGTCGLRTQEYDLNAPYDVLPTPVRAGNRFMGWYTAPRGGTKVSGKTLVSNAVTTLYAHWARIVTIRFDANGGTCSLASKEYAMNYSYAKLPTPVRAEHRFLGWFTHPTEGTEIVASTKVSSSVTTLYAHWLHLVTLTFNGNGGQVEAASQQYVVDTRYGSFPSVQRSGYKCAGWFTAASGGTKITINSNATSSVRILYAQWGKPIKVTFDPNGGTCATVTKTFAKGYAYFSLPKPTRKGYLFLGWFTAAHGGTQVRNSSVAAAGVTTLYAQWQTTGQASYDDFVWCYGGFNGAGARPLTDCEIANLNVEVNRNRMTYSWIRGGCETLGASGSTDFNYTLACLFVRVNGVWRGGKFDWISTSRTSRDLKNIFDGYRGWKSSDLQAADAYAFVIVSKDGSRRSNVIFQGL